MSRILYKSLNSSFTVIAILKEVHNSFVSRSAQHLDPVEILSPSDPILEANDAAFEQVELGVRAFEVFLLLI